MTNKSLWLIPFALWLAGCGERRAKLNDCAGAARSL